MTQSQQSRKKLRELITVSAFSAIIIVMTAVPYTGYITYGVIEITTLHIVTIIAAVTLGAKSGAAVGAVWGLSCIVRAYVMFPVYLSFGFGNFFVACLPRLLVGLLAGAVFMLLKRTRLPKIVSAGISAAVGTVTNTVLVLSAMNIWLAVRGEESSEFFGVFKSILQTLVGINGIIELAAAIIIVPAIYKSLSSYLEKQKI